MADKTLTEIRAIRGAPTLSGNSLIQVTEAGQTEIATLDELDLLLSGATVSQGVQDAFRGAEIHQITNATVKDHDGAITWEGDVTRDTDSFYSGAASTRLTVPAGVTKVRLHCYLDIGSSTTFVPTPPTDGEASIVMNGVTTIASQFWFGSGVAWPGSSVTNRGTPVSMVSPVIDVTAGDYFEAVASSKVHIGSANSASGFVIEVVEVAA